LSNWVTIANPCSPLKGKRGRMLGKHWGDYGLFYREEEEEQWE